MTFPRNSTDFLTPDLDDQHVWRACIGLDLADRTVLGAEVLIWRVVQQKRATPTRQSRKSAFLLLFVNETHVAWRRDRLARYRPRRCSKAPRVDRFEQAGRSRSHAQEAEGH